MKEMLKRYHEGMRQYYFPFALVFGIIGILHFLIPFIVQDYVFSPEGHLIAGLIIIITFLGLVFSCIDWNVNKKNRSWIAFFLCIVGLFFAVLSFIIREFIGTSGIII